MSASEVAIVGMAAVFPGAADLDAYWANLAGGVDAITAVPAARWDPVYFDPAATAVDRFYCARGGFIDDVAAIDPIALGIMPVAVDGAEPDQLLALAVAARAIADAGGTIARERAGVILGRGGYLGPGVARLSQRVRTAQQLVTTLAELVPELDAATLDRIRAGFQAQAGAVGPEAAIGLVPNLAASRIANRLDLRGPAYTIDAACASSLLAVDQACRELTSGRCDVVLAGGVHVCHDVTFWSVFTQLGALSRAQQIRPFDRRADGILIGEGAGVVVLERRADAERAGRRIYAIIKGAGVSSDGREATAMRPRLDGQLAALADAWRAAGCDPATVGLVEAHGTGTPVGDEVELHALARHFGAAERERAVLGSVKSMIGHAMPAAGAAGLIKAALAIHHGVRPPTLHCEEPHPAMAETRFRAIAAAEPWEAAVRRAGVSGFGFGGINAHVVLEQAGAAVRSPRRALARSGPATAAPSDALLLAADSIAGLRAALDGDRAAAAGGPVRLALLDPTRERRDLARKVLERGRPWRGKSDLWFAPRALAADGGRLAFVFPGVEAAFAPRIDDDTPPAVAAAIAAPADDLERRGLGVFALGQHLARTLLARGVRPHAIAGHSIGEWTGMVVSEMIPPADAAAFVAGLNPGSLEVPDVVFAAIGCSAAGAAAALDGLDAIAVSHDNCPHQSIVCGRPASVQAAIARLAARGVLCQELPFRSGFHSPLLADYLGPHVAHLRGLALQPPAIPLWSATTCAPYPDDPAAIRALAIDHLVQPVRFRELTEALVASGVRGFVQLGVGSVASFIGDTLRAVEHLAIAAASPQHDAAAQLARVEAALFADGFVDDAPAPAAVAAPTRKLAIGAPLVRLAGTIPPLALDPELAAIAGGDDPVLAELAATLREAAATSRAVVAAWRQARVPTERVTRRTLSVEAEPALADHCFYRQPPGWPHVGDRYPVVPMTMLIELMLDAARALVPGQVAIVAEDVRAFRWLAVAPPVEVELRARRTGPDRVEVELPGYAQASVGFAAHYPPAPAPALPALASPRPAPIGADRLYADRWMFHGPRYAGVTGLGPLDDGGVDGAIETLPAPGALLDCAGQLMGWWVMERERVDRLAMPVRIERLRLYGDHPAPGTRVACRVRFRSVGERSVVADHELTVGGRLWACADGWEDRRFDSDDALWKVLRYPEHHALAEPQPGGWVVAREHWRTAASRELVMRRYLDERERAAYEAVGPRGRRGWLLGRIAQKDAVRLRAWQRGGAALYPVEIATDHDEHGAPLVRGPATDGVRVSVAHKDELAVALASDRGAPGVDVERIEPRPPALLAVAFTDGELALIRALPGDEWLARLWAAKEALAKARGTGLGDPRRLAATAIAGDRVTLDGVAVDTRRDGDHVIAWTILP